jgi:hypothetical protein
MYHVEKEVLKILAPPISLLTWSTLCIQPPRPLTVPRMSFEDKKAYIKRRMCSILVKRAVVAYGREVGALGRLFKPHSGSQPRISPFLWSEMTVLSQNTLELSFPTIKRDWVVVGSQSEACFGRREWGVRTRLRKYPLFCEINKELPKDILIIWHLQ